MCSRSRAAGTAAAVLVAALWRTSTPTMAAGTESTYLVLARRARAPPRPRRASRPPAARSSPPTDRSACSSRRRRTPRSPARSPARASSPSPRPTDWARRSIDDDDHRDGRRGRGRGHRRPDRPSRCGALQWDMAQIDVAEAHAVTTGDPSVVVGVLDCGHLERPPRPRDADREGQERLVPGRRRRHERGRVEPDDLVARHARRRHDRRGDQRRRHRGRGAGREGRLGEGRQRRRLHLPRGGDLRLTCGRPTTACRSRTTATSSTRGSSTAATTRASARSGRPCSARSAYSQGEGHPHGRLGRATSNVDLQHKFIDVEQPERRQLPRRGPHHHRRVPRPAGRGARRGDGLGRRHRASRRATTRRTARASST